MAATTFRTFYNARDAIDFVADVTKLRQDGWGPWHELGHQHQQTNVTWPETVEVTVNIYSLAVERALGLSSRLSRDNVWPEIMAYLGQPEENKNYNAPEVGLFVRLGLYQQLWLQYGDDFFIDLHRKVREEGLTLSTTSDKMGYFMLKSSEVAGNDLSDFFRKWGYAIDEEYYEEVASLNLPIPEVDLTTLQD